jgi:hypothetical protein
MFLVQLWDGGDNLERSAFRIARHGDGSTLEPWDVNRDSVTEHDRRHELVRSYLARPNAAREREVATALRPILEAFMRVAYPAEFPPGKLLGPFLNECQQRINTDREILNFEDIQDLLEYVNRFHHDTNAAYQTQHINDLELRQFAVRTLAFTRRVSRRSA